MEKNIIELFSSKGSVWVESYLSDDNFEWQTIFKELQKINHSSARFLDIGSGKGKFVGKLHSLGFKIAGVEPARSLLDEACKLYPDAEFANGSATNLPYPDNTFDGVICVEVLEHIPDTDQALREMRRVLKPNGKTIIIDKNIRSLHYLYFVPTLSWKFIKELTNQWMYPINFPFREKYFVPQKLLELLQKYFKHASVEFISFVPENKKRTRIKQILWKLHGWITSFLYLLVPSWSFYVVWKGIK